MIGKNINGYTILHLIDSGGMADVFFAKNQLGVPAAIKVLKQKFSDEAIVRDRFLQEAKIMVSLNHPNIGKVHDINESFGRPAIIMEYLEGTTLKFKIEKEQKMTDEQLNRYFIACCDALAYTHQRTITHRDIKPSNIFITTKDEVKVMDFGIAKSGESVIKTQTGQALGTILYMSPEQVKDPKRVNHKSDIYSLGVTFYHALTKKNPYDANTNSEFTIQSSIVNEPLDLSIISPFWRQRLQSMLDKDPRNRPEAASFIGKHSSDETYVAERQKPTQTIIDRPKSKTGIPMWAKFSVLLIILSAIGFTAIKLMGETATPEEVVIAPSQENLWESVMERGVLRVGVEPEAPPLNYIDGENRRGLDYELINEIARNMGIAKVEFNEAFYYDNLPEEAQKGTFDIFMGGYVPDPDIKDIIWSDPYLDFGLCLIVAKGSAIEGIKDLRGKRIAVYEGDNVAKQWVEENVKDFQAIKPYTDDADINWMDCINRDEVDAVIYDYPFAVEEIKNFDNLKIVQLNLNDSKYSVGIPGKRNFELLAKLNLALRNVKQKPVYGEIIKKYLKSDHLEVNEIKSSSDFQIYEVKRGETLGSIAASELGSGERWDELWKANKGRLANAHLIFPGDRILIPTNIN